MQNAKGRLVRAYTGPAGSKKTDLFYSYSARGEIVDVYQSTATSGGKYYHVSGTYWAHGALKTQSQAKAATSAAASEVTFAGLPAITYGVNAAGRVSAVNDGSAQNPVTGVTYAPAGSIPAPAGYLTGVTYGSQDVDTFTPDVNTGRMTQFKYAVNGQNVIGDLTWNANGSLKTLAYTNPFHAGSTMTCNYTHDDLARIASVDCPGKWAQDFTYDAFGNINKSGNVSFLATYAPATNRVTNLGITYDTNGNITNDGMHPYQWDAEGRTQTAEAIGVTYDAFDRMVEQDDGGTYTRFLYGVQGEKLATVAVTALIQGFVALPGGGTAVYTSSGLSFYRHADWLGSTRFASTPSRTMHYSRGIAPYGEPNYGSNTIDKPSPVRHRTRRTASTTSCIGATTRIRAGGFLPTR